MGDVFILALPVDISDKCMIKNNPCFRWEPRKSSNYLSFINGISFYWSLVVFQVFIILPEN